MKHILNDLTEQEKNSIREQHTGGMKVMTESFSKLLNSKLGDSKPLVSEEPESSNYGKEYLGDKALKYLTDTLKPFGFVHQSPRQWAPDMIYKTGLPEGEDINITFDEVWGSGPTGNTSKHQFELYIRTNNQKEIIKKYPFEKKDDYAGSPVLKQILSDLGQWKTYKPSDRPMDYQSYE